MNRLDEGAVVALFVRAPVPGRVKTRLAAALGEEGACCLYQAMVIDILANCVATGMPLYLFYADPTEHGIPKVWREAATRVWPQRGRDIGVRMATAFADCFAENIERVVVVGSDIPDLTVQVICAARDALAAHDVVLVPAVDGGYGLIALQRERFRPELFAGIPWSTNRVLAATLQRCAACSLDAHLLAPLRDIDTLADLTAYQRKPCPAAPSTNQMVAQLLPPEDAGGCLLTKSREGR